jgi:ergothioneine biosynthesis protein EgtB
MSTRPQPRIAGPSSTALFERYRQVRAQTEALAAPLTAEDQLVQSMPDVSPTKWHRAHTTWFFEQFVLNRHKPGYRCFDASYDYLFNSYYEAVGERHPRPQRGLLSRPTAAAVTAYRDHVDEHMAELLAALDPDGPVAALILLGTHHEQQHQELLLTDIKHVFSVNPLRPAYHGVVAVAAGARGCPPLRFVAGESGVVELGHAGEGFHFDNEGPRHRVFLEPHAIADRPVNNGEFLEFVRDGGYRRPSLWLSDGWATVQARGWERPLYWHEDLATEFTLAGDCPLDPQAPVSHLSYYEADAFARWAGARLPTEAEWERFAADRPLQGNLCDSGVLHPRSLGGSGVRQLFGDVWEWTASAYAAYPGYRPAPGAVGEYNGKFMCNQLVLRGGSCVTPAGHLRPTYRNFFYPDARWQFSGCRLARDLP